MLTPIGPPAPPQRIPASRATQAVAGVIGFAAGAYLAFGLSDVSGALRILLFVALFPIAVLIHELGHLAAGCLVGFQPMLLIVGPMKIRRTLRGWQMERMRPAIAGGIAGALPKRLEALERRVCVLIAGGPAANVLTAAAAIAASTFTEPSSIIGAALGVLVVVSVICALVALVPAGAWGFFTDGARIQQLLAGGAAGERWAALFALSAASTDGARPRDYPPALVSKLDAASDETLDEATARLYRYAVALDTDNVESAREHLRRALAIRDHVPVMKRPTLHLAAAFFVAWYDRDATAAEQHLALANDALLNRAAGIATRAAIAAVKGDLAAMDHHIHAGLTACDDEIDRGSAIVTREFLQMLAAREWALPKAA